MNDFYAILGVPSTADDAAIKSAYRKLAKEYHPDTNHNKGAEARFKDVNEAYETLKDPQKRAAYDYQRRGPQQGSRGWNPGHQGFGTGSPHQPFRSSEIDLEEILRDIRRSRSPFGEDAKNRDIVLSYSITLEEAFHGKEATTKYNLAGQAPKELQFKITPGVVDGVKLRFQGKGDNAMDGVPPGDLFIKINIIPHATFIRMGYNLVTSVTVNYLDAILGTEKEIPTIEGKKIKMRIPANIQPGQSLRAAGKGMPQSGKRGDMMVEIIFTPIELSAEERKILENLRSKRNG
jgi:DnaJ-class molecular chaperone